MKKIIAVSAVLLLLAAPTIPDSMAWSDVSQSQHEIVDMVSEGRIMSTIGDLEGFGSRAFYMASSNDSAEYIYDRFSELGLKVEYQNFFVGSRSVRNVVATLNGSADPDHLFLFGAHYDSENAFAQDYYAGANLSAPGADDDASGVAAVIELATVLSDHHISNTIKFVAFGAEELGYDKSGGLKGSTYFVEADKTPRTSYIGSAIMDMIGYPGVNGNHIVAIVNSNEGPLPRATLNAISTNALDMKLDVKVNASVRWSDHYPFWVAGIPCTLLTEETGGPDEHPLNPYYHSSNDTSDKLSGQQLENITMALVGAVIALSQQTSSDGLGIWIESGLVALGAIIITLIYIHWRKAVRE